MDHNESGLALLDKGDAAAALVSFTRALTEHPTSPDYYINRSKAFARLNPPRQDLGLKDAEIAIARALQRGKRDKVQAAQVRRVVGYFSSGQYVHASNLIALIGIDEKEKMLAIWKAKVDKKLKEMDDATRSHLEETTKTEKYPSVKLPTDKDAVAMLKKQINDDGSFNFDAAEGKTTNGQNKSDTLTTEESQVENTRPAVAVPIRQDWFQTPATVTVSIFAKGVDKEKLQCDIKEDSVYVSFPNPGDSGSEYSFSIDPAYAAIDVNASKVNVLKTKIEIVLQKAAQGNKWKALEGTEKLVVETSSKDNAPIAKTETKAKETPPAYPTSSKKGVKNWDKVAADLTAHARLEKMEARKAAVVKDSKGSESSADEADAAGSDADDSGDDVDSFFKRLYKGSDDDTRRAMMKSYYESNGTSLSTNWQDVGSKRVKPYQSPDGDD